MEKRKYTSPQTEIAQVDISEILVIIADSETNTQWAPHQNNYDDSFVFEEYDDYGIKYDNYSLRSLDDRIGLVWE